VVFIFVLFFIHGHGVADAKSLHTFTHWPAFGIHHGCMFTHVTEDLQVFSLPIACIYGSSVTDAMFTHGVAELLANFPSIARTCCEYPAAFSLLFFSFLFLSQNGKHGGET
jgi:hypothetical protein